VESADRRHNQWRRLPGWDLISWPGGLFLVLSKEESQLLPERPAKRLPVDNKYYNDNFFA
jgi:hypothetical protein